MNQVRPGPIHGPSSFLLPTRSGFNSRTGHETQHEQRMPRLPQERERMKLVTDSDPSTWSAWETYCGAGFMIRCIDNNDRDARVGNWIFELADPVGTVFGAMTGEELAGLGEYIHKLLVKQNEQH